jgi:hypothetical protein
MPYLPYKGGRLSPFSTEYTNLYSKLMPEYTTKKDPLTTEELSKLLYKVLVNSCIKHNLRFETSSWDNLPGYLKLIYYDCAIDILNDFDVIVKGK